MKTIWSNYSYNYDYLLEEIDYLLAELDYHALQQMNNRPADIIALADLGLWYGRVKAYKEIGNVQDCFSCMEDYAEFYIDSHGNFRCKTSHHDGTNNILFREWKQGLSEVQRDNFLNRWISGAAKSADISRYTKRLDVTLIYE